MRPTLPETPDSCRNDQHSRRWFRNGGVHRGARAVASRLAEVGAPRVVAGLRAVVFAPHDIVGRVDGAIRVIVAQWGRLSHGQLDKCGGVVDRPSMARSQDRQTNCVERPGNAARCR